MAGQAHGFDNTVVIGKETSFGTAPSSYKWAGLVESFEPEETKNVDQRRSVGVRAPIMLREGASEVDGTLTVALQNGRLLAYALGQVGKTGDATAGFTHTITPAGRGQELPSMTVQNHNSLLNFTRNYVGGKVDTITLTATAEEAVMLESELLFSHFLTTGITPATVTAELDNYYMFYEGSVKINNTAVSNVTEFELEVSNNLERRFVLNGSKRPARIEEGSLEITASLTMDVIDKTHLEAFNNGDEIAVSLILQDVANTKRSITINLIGGLYDTNNMSVGAEDLQEQELEAVFKDIQIIVKDPTDATLL
jgi:hypothetical protein